MKSPRPTIQAAVDRLLSQYKEYLLLDSAASEAKTAYEQRLLTIAKESSKTVQEVIEHVAPTDSQLAQLSAERQRYARMRDRISDEMTFATPEVWMRYKAIAYKGTPNELATWEAFRQHCTPDGYICTKRYQFLKAVAQQLTDVSLDELDANTALIHVCHSAWLQTIEQNSNVMKQWQDYEFFMENNRVAKWENVA